MKRSTLLVALIVLALLLTACGSRTSSGGSFTITPESRLALGTLKLEGTSQAIDKATAAKLLPLWQLLQQLNTSTSAAPQEITAVLDQIQATMTPEQTHAIESMQITQADFAAAFQQARSATSGRAAGGGAGGSGTAGSNRGGGGGGQGFFPGGGGGGFPGGGFPGGGFASGGTGTANGTPSASAGGTSSGSGQSSTNRSAAFVVGEVVRLLESKIGT